MNKKLPYTQSFSISFFVLGLVWCLTNPVFLSAQDTPGDVFGQVFQSVVLIKNESFLTESATKPWMKESLTTGWGTGLIISKNQILTNAHVVRNSKYLTVQHYNRKKTYQATLKFSAMDCDLAILEVNDPDFSEGLKIFPFSESKPKLGSELLILGYPNGTENLTVEKGNVLSVEKVRYSFSGLDFRKAIRVKASVFPGNSGGPAFQGDKVVGLVFQISQTTRDNAYLIPTSIIRHFLNDIQDGKYDGFPNLGFTYQSGEGRSMKESKKIPSDTQGIFLNSIYPKSAFFDFLKPGDFIFRVDEYYLTQDGDLISDKKQNLVDYIEEKFVGEPVTFYFFRDGKKYKTTANLSLTQSLDLYREESGDYYLNSGLVFQPVSRIFFSTMDFTNMDSSAKYHFSYFIQDRLYRYTNRDILLSYVFNDPENFLYHSYKYKVVETINGYSPQDLKHFNELFGRFSHEPILIKFRGVDLPIVITPENRKKINIRVQKRYGVQNDFPE